MMRLLSDFLARNKITITELIHRADMLDKLEATGTLYQHAIQKIAVAQAASGSVPVQQIVKNLNELTTQATQRVIRDQRKGLFPNPRSDQFAELAAGLAGKGDAAYLFNGALARHLQRHAWLEREDPGAAGNPGKGARGRGGAGPGAVVHRRRHGGGLERFHRTA